MRKLFILVVLFILCIIILISKEKHNDYNIDIKVRDNEIGLIFIKTNTSNHILYKKNNKNILIHINGDNNIDKILNKINQKIDYNINTKNSLLKYDIYNNKDNLYIEIFDKKLCIYSSGNTNNCDYVYFINETNNYDNINLAFYNENISNEFENNLYNNWVDMYKIKNNEIIYATFTKDDYNIVKLPINN